MAIQVPPVHVQYPAAWLTAVLPVHKTNANRTLRRSARANGCAACIGSGAPSRVRGLDLLAMMLAMKEHRRSATLIHIKRVRDEALASRHFTFVQVSLWQRKPPMQPCRLSALAFSKVTVPE